jgi:glycosyltransferase involved in cell wall biosynthesis
MRKVEDRYDVSVVIPTYNRREILSYTLLSLSKQEMDKDKFEVVIIDDGSTDDTRDMVKTFETQLHVTYRFLKDSGHTPSTARNQGILHSEGRICLLLDSGVIMKSDCVSEHIDFYKKRPSGATAIGYVYGFFAPVEVEEEMVRLIVTDDPAESFRRMQVDDMFLDVRDQHYPEYNDQLEDLPAPWFYYWSCHISAIRKDLIDVGLFDENYNGKWGVEDNDLGYRLQLKGIRTYLLRSAQTIHYPHYRSWLDMREQGTKNCLYFHNKFQTLETKLFLDYYMHPDFLDINKMIINQQLVEKVG